MLSENCWANPAAFVGAYPVILPLELAAAAGGTFPFLFRIESVFKHRRAACSENPPWYPAVILPLQLAALPGGTNSRVRHNFQLAKVLKICHKIIVENLFECGGSNFVTKNLMRKSIKQLGTKHFWSKAFPANTSSQLCEFIVFATKQ